MIVGRPVQESPHKRVREEASEEEDSSNDSGRLIRRKGKKMMSLEPFPKIQIKPLQGVKIIDLQDSDKSPSPSIVSFSPIR